MGNGTDNGNGKDKKEEERGENANSFLGASPRMTARLPRTVPGGSSLISCLEWSRVDNLVSRGEPTTTTKKRSFSSLHNG